MSLTSCSAGLVTTVLAASGIAIPLAAAGSASAACQEGVRFTISEHERTFLTVGGTTITFKKPGTHRVEIVKKAVLSAKYGTGNVDDQRAIRTAVQAKWPKVKNAVPVTKGHRETFRSGPGERVKVSYGSNGDRVRWTKIDVDPDCSGTVLAEGTAKFPRRNLDWLFAVAIS